MGVNNRKVNTFSKGQAQDINKYQQPEGTYRVSNNGRVIYNEDGTYAYENEKGNALAFTILADYGNAPSSDTYIPIGFANFPDKMILFCATANKDKSEIGKVVFDSAGIGTYSTLFNDQYDPNNNKLNFDANYPIWDAIPSYEEEDIQRVYWCDGYNEDRAFNVMLGADFNYATPYPYTYSVHSMAIIPDAVMGAGKFIQEITGSLLSGLYQVTYRYVTADGTRSMWMPLSNHVFVTTYSKDSTDWNTYGMGESGIQTNKGLQFYMGEDADTRFHAVECCYVYSQTANTPIEARIFATVAPATMGANSVEANLIFNGGEVVDLNSLPITFGAIKNSQTMKSQDNRLFKGNIDYYPRTIIADLSAMDVHIRQKRMRSDMADTATTRTDAEPLVHGDLATGTIDMIKFIDNTSSFHYREFPVVNDYTNTKGMQVESVHRSYPRGETVRFGLLFFTKKMLPCFVQHLADVTLPQMYSSSWSWIGGDGTSHSETLAGGAPWLTTQDQDGTIDTSLDRVVESVPETDLAEPIVLGFTFHGIDITAIKDDIAGYCIVRCDIDRTTIAQGLVMNTVYDPDDDGVTYPLPGIQNKWSGGNYDGCKIATNGTHYYARRYNTFTFDSPDFEIDPSGIPPLNEDIQNILLVGACGDYNDNGKQTQTSGVLAQIYQKLYATSSAITFTTALGTSGTFQYMGVADVDNIGASAIQYNPTPILFDNQTNGKDIDVLSGANLTDKSYARGHNIAMIMELNTIANAACNYGLNYNWFYLANYRKQHTPYGGYNQASLDASRYYFTGHWQAVSEEFLSYIEDSGTYVVNGVEVWGGDTTVDFNTFLRLYPNYNVDNPDDYNDYSVGMVFPVESRYNFMLRVGNNYAQYGAKPKRTWNGNTTDFTNGLYIASADDYKEEEFNLNVCMLSIDSLVTYTPKNSLFTERLSKPNQWVYSEIKIAGEIEDSWRKFLVNNFFDTNAIYGAIQGSSVLFNRIYSFQNNAYGWLEINPRNEMVTTDGTQVYVGTGSVLQRINYISTIYGSQHQGSIKAGERSIGFIDVNMGAICRHGGNGFEILSDVHWLHTYSNTILKQFFGNNLPITGVGLATEYDFNNKEYIFALHGFFKTILIYSEAIEAFHGNYFFAPDKLLSFGGYTYGHYTDYGIDNQQVWLNHAGDRGEYFGVDGYNTLVTFIVHPQPEYYSVFDRVMVQINADGASLLQTATFETESQTAVIDVATDARVEYKNGILRIPCTEILAGSPRLRGKSMTVTLNFINEDNKLLRILDVVTLWRLSSPT